MVADVARIDLQIRHGESPYELKLQFLGANNIPIDFTGCVGVSQIRNRNGDLIQDFAVTFLPQGWVHLTIANTLALPIIRTGRYDLWITYPDGRRQIEAEGQVAIAERVTP
jgi:hypothetical protein